MVSWLVIVLDVGGSVIFLSSYNHHMSLEASRAQHDNRVVLITSSSWTHFNCQQVHKIQLQLGSRWFHFITKPEWDYLFIDVACLIKSPLMAVTFYSYNPSDSVHMITLAARALWSRPLPRVT